MVWPLVRGNIGGDVKNPIFSAKMMWNTWIESVAERGVPRREGSGHLSVLTIIVEIYPQKKVHFLFYCDGFVFTFWCSGHALSIDPLPSEKGCRTCMVVCPPPVYPVMYQDVHCSREFQLYFLSPLPIHNTQHNTTQHPKATPTHHVHVPRKLRSARRGHPGCHGRVLCSGHDVLPYYLVWQDPPPRPEEVPRPPAEHGRVPPAADGAVRCAALCGEGLGCPAV